ncbi:MAG: IS1182 family transposase [Niabella sp.]
MKKRVFKSNLQGQISLFPARLDQNIPKDSPVKLVNQIVDELDISAIERTYKAGGCSAFHPRMMLKVLFYAYMNNIYSCRKIGRLLQENIHYMWLSGNQTPDFRTINYFRSHHLKDTINQVFTQVVLLLVEMGQISLNTVYIDGTKMESRAGRYTFVWRKTVEKNKAKLETKIREILKMIDSGIAQDDLPDDGSPTPIDSDELKKRIAQINRENLSKQEQKAVKTLEKQHLPKLREYENHLNTLGERNSYSKTDKSATFMRLKDDHMQNGQLKPAYNLQIGTEKQFITHFDFFPNPTDTLTMIPFFEGWAERYNAYPETTVADAGYGSEENYGFMEDNEMEAFVKYNYFHAEQKKKFRENAFITQNLYYNATDDYFVCPMGQHLENKGSKTTTNKNGHQAEITIYTAANCKACPPRGMCFKGKANRSIEVNHNLNRLRAKARELLLSKEGIKQRKKRCVEPEPVFLHIRYDGGYLRFRHFKEDRIKIDFTILAIALNLSKLGRRLSGKDKNTQKSSVLRTATASVPLNLIKIGTHTKMTADYLQLAA